MLPRVRAFLRRLVPALAVAAVFAGLVGIEACRNTLAPGEGEGEGDGGEGETGEGEGECPGEPVPGLHVYATDENDFPVCDATVQAIDEDDAAETLMPFGAGAACGYEGAYDRPGTYELVVNKTGYQELRAPGVVVNADGCHAQTKDVALPNLVPES